MPLRNENDLVGLDPNSPWQEGVSNADTGQIVESDWLLPWPSDPASSWMYYECSIDVMLDSGIVVHHRLPQVDNTHDTLGSADLTDPRLDKRTKLGVNLNSNDSYEDVVQRMAHSRYWFNLRGQAMRVGYQVPIPRLKTIAGVKAIPHDKNPQWAYNAIAPGGNFGGVILWEAGWSLWYTTDRQPSGQMEPELFVSPAAHITGAVRLPTGIIPPQSDADDNARPPAGRRKADFVRGQR